MYGGFLVAIFLMALALGPARAQMSVAAQCQRACEQQNPDINGAAYRQCLAMHCAEAFANEQPRQEQSNPAPPPPSAAVSASGAWSTVGFEERTAVVMAAQGKTTLNYNCDGRGGHYIEILGVGTEDRVIGMMFDNASVHYPTMSNQPTGFQIRLWKDHPLIQAIKAGSAVRVFEGDGRLIGDFSLRNSSRAIGAAEANCGI